MVKNRRVLPLMVAVGSCVLVGVLPACTKPQAAAPLDATWLPSAKARFATIDRDTHLARVHADGEDLLIFEDNFDDGGLVWVLNIPATPKMNMPLELGSADDAPVRGWVMEKFGNKRWHTVPLEGNLVIHSKEADTLRATVDVSAVRHPAAAGAEFDSRVRLTRKLEWTRTAAVTPEYAELTTRSGMKK